MSTTGDVITATFREDGRVEVDLGGDLDLGCCGCEASALHDELAALGVRLSLKKVRCRLPVAERVRAKAAGTCRWDVANFTKQDGDFGKEGER